MFKKEKPETTTDTKTEKPEIIECKNRKTDLENDQNRKTENPNTPLHSGRSNQENGTTFWAVP